MRIPVFATIYRSMRMAPSRHMTSDDPFPEKTPGLVRLYSMQYCPYAMRARLLLAKKGVRHEIINIHLRKKPQWFLDKYPVGTVPVMELDDKLLGGSLVVAEYVDEVYSKEGERTLSSDPYERARTNMLIADKFGKAITAVYKRLYGREGWQEDFSKHVGELETELSTKKYFAGEKVTFADYMIWPWMRLIAADSAIPDVLPTGKFPNLARWIEDMKTDETVKACHTSPEILKKFCEGYPTGNYVYDLEVCSQ